MLEQESGGMGNRSPGLSPLNQRALHHGAATELCCAALPACRAVLCLLCPHHSTSGYCILGRPPPNAYTRPPSVAAAARLPRAVPKGASGCQAPPNAPAHLRGCGTGGWGGWVGGWSDAAGRCLEAGTTRQPTGPASRHPTNRAPGGTRAAGAAPEHTPQRRWSRNQQAARGEGVPPGARRHLLFLPGGAASGLPTDPAHSDWQSRGSTTCGTHRSYRRTESYQSFPFPPPTTNTSVAHDAAAPKLRAPPMAAVGAHRQCAGEKKSAAGQRSR
jgi:hypothetical protein